jgi:membrane protein required for colicin V production
LNWVDILILVTMLWFTYAAFHAGLIREVITIIGAVAAVALAGLFYEDLAVDIKVAVDSEETARIIAFALIFGSVILASQLTALFLKQAASLLLLGIFDSMGGAMIGLLKGFVFVEIALIVGITFQSLGVQDSIDHSSFAPFFLDALPVLKTILPGEFKTAIDGF